MLHIGLHDYGKVDVVPGLLSVKTRFFHISFCPLIPMGSKLVPHPQSTLAILDDVPIPLCGKSVAFAYLRAGLVFAIATTVIIVVISAIEASRGRSIWASELLVGSGCLLALVGVYYGTHVLGRASLERAIALGATLGFSTQQIEDYFASEHMF